ncbi:MAG: hypothetical protein UW86_C0005G0025 [Microgenomates group bacterium GW2011_GWA1_Microgenomates_45_10]|nr:MAG: hypothetical protein UW69_C0005G0026 [Microgenomates group bacterium GW2011_GWA2_44_7]KKT87284.1 MAG: hypothetical protein UW86_C0005G0025 [Microgenomates group bacterium GW2011_GWA1_Microgenomates_45_10]
MIAERETDAGAMTSTSVRLVESINPTQSITLAQLATRLAQTAGKNREWAYRYLNRLRGILFSNNLIEGGEGGATVAFLHDRLRQEVELAGTFGWTNINFGQTLRLLTAISGCPREIVNNLITEVIAARYSLFIGRVLQEHQGVDIPPVILQVVLPILIEDVATRLRIAQGIKKASAGIESGGHHLTPCEYAVLFSVAQGKSNRVIACELGMAYRTVRNHLSSLFAKFSKDDDEFSTVRNRIDLTVIATGEGIVPKPSLDDDLTGKLYLIYRLTERERVIFRRVGEGCTNKEIANEFRISRQTVKNHAASIMSKLDAASRTQVATLYDLDQARKAPEKVAQDKNELIQIEERLRQIFNEIPAEGQISPRRLARSVEVLQKVVGRVIALGLKEDTVESFTIPRFFHWMTRWEDIRCFLNQQGADIPAFEDCIRRMGKIEQAFFETVADRKLRFQEDTHFSSLPMPAK